jgi:hypothetical protein
MADEKNWLIVTNYSGVMHKMPLANKAHYEGQNRRVKKFQYKFREMPNQEAIDFIAKHNGRDPDHMTPAKVTSILSDKDRQIEDLKAQLAALQTNVPDQSAITAHAGPGRPKKVEPELV